eukprot:TRINITY_DN190_c3_g1_i4.p1 TRINITY_DN190_c3_g1~~TRINITY_DN190_c3_g1_i4.p1  ORF type:complete len:266 (-),score=100.84 TRINITY_DN190_c3_g1_i4:507-1304(-)
MMGRGGRSRHHPPPPPPPPAAAAMVHPAFPPLPGYHLPVRGAGFEGYFAPAHQGGLLPGSYPNGGGSALMRPFVPPGVLPPHGGVRPYRANGLYRAPPPMLLGPRTRGIPQHYHHSMDGKGRRGGGGNRGAARGGIPPPLLKELKVESGGDLMSGDNYVEEDGEQQQSINESGGNVAEDNNACGGEYDVPPVSNNNVQDSEHDEQQQQQQQHILGVDGLEETRGDEEEEEIEDSTPSCDDIAPLPSIDSNGEDKTSRQEEKSSAD